MAEEFIERRIITGLIVSTEYIQRCSSIIKPKLFVSPTAGLLARWCLEYFRQYDKAPGRDIEGIFSQKLKEGLHQDRAEWIERVLDSMSTDYNPEQFNVTYLTDETKQFFKEQHLRRFTDEIRDRLDRGKITEAEGTACQYVTVAPDDNISVDPFDVENSYQIIDRAFSERKEKLIHFPRALGTLFNYEMVRGGFVGIVGPEKSGKSFWLMEFAFRALRSGSNVAFFEAGDQSKEQKIRRMGIYLCRRSDEERYCNELFIPEVDCLYHQVDSCDKSERERGEGIGVSSEEQILEFTYDDLVSKYDEFLNHRTCRNCESLKGVIWFKRRPPVIPIDSRDAKIAFANFRDMYPSKFEIISYPSDTLTVMEIKSVLTIWEKTKRFVPDVVIIDYLDLLAPDPDVTTMSRRDQINSIWMRVRGLSLERDFLVIGASQTDSRSYGKSLIDMSNFSEDKRKHAHLTAEFGLNRTWEEELIGITRVNEVVVRESGVDRHRPVKVLQRLEIGRPFLASFR